MRIIAGKFHGRLLKSPKGTQTRPTTSIVRKSVFDICQDRIDGARFLDLFAGTGAMGIEALSRGASHATFIEKDRQALRCIRDNLMTLQLQDVSRLMNIDAMDYLRKKKERFDIIYIDPPYSKVAENLSLLKIIDDLQLVNEGGILFLEEGDPLKTGVENLKLSHLKWINTRRFGKSLLHQFRSSPNVRT